MQTCLPALFHLQRSSSPSSPYIISRLIWSPDLHVHDQPHSTLPPRAPAAPQLPSIPSPHTDARAARAPFFPRVPVRERCHPPQRDKGQDHKAPGSCLKTMQTPVAFGVAFPGKKRTGRGSETGQCNNPLEIRGDYALTFRLISFLSSQPLYTGHVAHTAHLTDLTLGKWSLARSSRGANSSSVRLWETAAGVVALFTSGFVRVCFPIKIHHF